MRFSTLGPTKGSARTCLGGGCADRTAELEVDDRLTGSAGLPVRELTQVAARLAACLLLAGLRVAPGAEKTVAGKQVVLVGGAGAVLL